MFSFFFNESTESQRIKCVVNLNPDQFFFFFIFFQVEGLGPYKIWNRIKLNTILDRIRLRVNNHSDIAEACNTSLN